MYSFFISHVAPYAPVIPKTIARCVVETLGKSGINTKTFKAHAHVLHQHLQHIIRVFFVRNR